MQVIVLYRSIKIEGYHTWIRDDFFMMMIMTMMTVVEKGLYKSSSVWYHDIRHRGDFVHDDDDDDDGDGDDDDGGGKSII